MSALFILTTLLDMDIIGSICEVKFSQFEIPVLQKMAIRAVSQKREDILSEMSQLLLRGPVSYHFIDRMLNRTKPVAEAYRGIQP